MEKHVWRQPPRRASMGSQYPNASNELNNVGIGVHGCRPDLSSPHLPWYLLRWTLKFHRLPMAPKGTDSPEADQKPKDVPRWDRLIIPHCEKCG